MQTSEEPYKAFLDAVSAKPTQSYESFLQELPAAREPPVLDLPAAQGAAATPALRHAVAAVPSSDKLRREWEAAAAEEDLDIQEIQPQSAGGPKDEGEALDEDGVPLLRLHGRSSSNASSLFDGPGELQLDNFIEAEHEAYDAESGRVAAAAAAAASANSDGARSPSAAAGAGSGEAPTLFSPTPRSGVASGPAPGRARVRILTPPADAPRTLAADAPSARGGTGSDGLGLEFKPSARPGSFSPSAAGATPQAPAAAAPAEMAAGPSPPSSRRRQQLHAALQGDPAVANAAADMRDAGGADAAAADEVATTVADAHRTARQQGAVDRVPGQALSPEEEEAAAVATAAAAARLALFEGSDDIPLPDAGDDVAADAAGAGAPAPADKTAPAADNAAAAGKSDAASAAASLAAAARSSSSSSSSSSPVAVAGTSPPLPNAATDVVYEAVEAFSLDPNFDYDNCPITRRAPLQMHRAAAGGGGDPPPPLQQ